MKLGYFKDETKSQPIKEVCVLKPKNVFLKPKNVYANENKKTAKGIKASVIQNLTHETYKNILLNSELLRHSQHEILSKGHTLRTILKNKISLTLFYDKK